MKYLYCTVFDAATGAAIESVLVAEKYSRDYGYVEYEYITPDAYFDSLARSEAPLYTFRDSCKTSSITGRNGADTLGYTGILKWYDDGRPDTFSTQPIPELLFAYRKGYKIWRFDPLRDTLASIPGPTKTSYTKEWRLSKIRLQKR